MSIHGVRDVSGLIDTRKKKAVTLKKSLPTPMQTCFRTQHTLVRIFRTVLLEGALSKPRLLTSREHALVSGIKPQGLATMARRNLHHATLC